MVLRRGRSSSSSCLSSRLAMLLLTSASVSGPHGGLAQLAAADEFLDAGRGVQVETTDMPMGRELVSETTPMPTVKVNAEPITLTLMVDFQDRVFFDVVRFRRTFLQGMAETLDITQDRLWIVRVRAASNKEWPQQDTTTTIPGVSPEDDVEEAEVEDRCVVEFWILDPPVRQDGKQPVHTAAEKARRLDALLNAESRGAWRGGLLAYIQGGVMVRHEAIDVYVPEGQFGIDGAPATYDPMSLDISAANILDNYLEPASCTCSQEMFDTLQVAAGCAEHFGLAPGFEEIGTPWCMVAVECNGALYAYDGYYVKCERSDDDNDGNRGVMRASEAGRGSGLPPLAVACAWVAVLISASVRA